MGKRPKVHVWDASTGAQVKVLPRFHKRAIPQVAFSPCGKMIASVGQDDDHSVCVWKSSSGEWTDGKRKARTKGSKNKVLFVHFTGTGDDYQVISGGDKHVMFYKLSGKCLKPKKGIFGKKGKIQPVLCAATVGGSVVTGTVSGHLYKWKGRMVDDAVTAHNKSVNSLFSCSDGSLVSGSKDGCIKIWSSTLESLAEFDMSDAGSSMRTSISSVCCDAAMTRVLVGTKGSEIYELQIDTGSAERLPYRCWPLQGGALGSRDAPDGRRRVRYRGRRLDGARVVSLGEEGAPAGEDQVRRPRTRVQSRRCGHRRGHGLQCGHGRPEALGRVVRA
jgi:microtubule-associated protein-like 6